MVAGTWWRQLRSDASWRRHDVLAHAYLSVVLLSLLPFGANDPIPFAFVAAAMFLLAIASAVLIGEPRRGRRLFVAALGTIVLLAACAYIQTLNMPFESLPHPAWKDASTITGTVGASISVAPADTFASILRMALPFITFMTGLLVSTSDERAEKIVRGLALMGGLIAVWGLGQFLLFPDTLLFAEKKHYLDSLTAVFINRNTAATFLGLTALVLAGLVVAALKDVPIQAVLDRIVNGNGGKIRSKIASLLFLALLLLSTITALLLTKSRAGIAGTVIALLFLVPFLAASWRTRKSNGFARKTSAPWKRMTWAAIGIVLLVAAVLPFAGRTLLRAEAQGGYDGRFCVLPGIVDAAASNWRTGTGFGTFATVFPAYRDPACEMSLFWDKAHNFYLEGFLGLGLVFPLAAAFVYLILIRTFWTGLRERRRMRIYPALGFAALILVGFHAFFDFSLQIPGFAVFFAALLAPVAAISLEHPKAGTRSGDNFKNS